MAGVLGIDLTELGACSSKSRSPVTFSSTCTVWAQADAIKLLNSGTSFEEIGSGINTAMANRVAVLLNSIGMEREICMTGGVAKNRGVKDALERIIGHRIKTTRKADPQLAGAIGAALFAQEKMSERES
jgi:activator of 2-hydroxyglutaryl-CoA dehydratase